MPPEPPPPPRRVKRTNAFGVFFFRLFISPHVIIGIGLLFAMAGIVIWQLAGKETEVTAIRIWEGQTQKGGTTRHVEYGNPVSGKLEQASINKTEYARLATIMPQGKIIPPKEEKNTHPKVRLKTLVVGKWNYTDVIEQGSSGWKRVGLVWAFGGFWNLIMGFAVLAAFVIPAREKKLHRIGIAVPGKITVKTTGRGSKGRTRYLLAYSYTPVGESARDASTELAGDEQDVTLAEWNAANEGDEIWVLHWPGKVQPSVIYGLGPYIVQ